MVVYIISILSIKIIIVINFIGIDKIDFNCLFVFCIVDELCIMYVSGKIVFFFEVIIVFLGYL